MKLSVFISLLFCFGALSSTAQKKWSLLDCVNYAMENNISVKQMHLQAEIAGINYKQNKLSQYPTLNFSNSEALRFGKSQNPSTGILENQNYFSIGINLQTSVQIFNWFSKKNAILADEWAYAAANAATEKMKNDVALTVANSFLQVLLAIEQEKIALVQVNQSISQLDIVKKQVEAGALPELNTVELESQLANDSANYITAKGNVTQALFVLKAYMNVDASEPFEIEQPPVELIPVEPIGDLLPNIVYALALENQPQQKMNEYNIQSAIKRSLSVRGALYPTISAFGSLGTNYGYFHTPTYEQIFSGYVPSGMVVSDGQGGYLSVQRPVFKNGDKNGYITSEPFSKQIGNNFGQQLGISINVPIFNGWAAKGNYLRSKINIENLSLQKELDNKTLKQNIYQAYNSAIVALEKYTSSKRAVESAQKSYDFALKRYNVGMLGTLELVTNQNNLFRAKLQYVANQFDYVFKMKILEFYKGQGIKL